MTTLLSIEEVKDFLKITDEFDKDYLEKIKVYAQDLLEKILDQKLITLLKTDGNLPGDLKVIWLSFIAHIYDERTVENILEKNSPILAKYQKIYL